MVITSIRPQNPPRGGGLKFSPVRYLAKIFKNYKAAKRKQNEKPFKLKTKHPKKTKNTPISSFKRHTTKLTDKDDNLYAQKLKRITSQRNAIYGIYIFTIKTNKLLLGSIDK